MGGCIQSRPEANVATSEPKPAVEVVAKPAEAKKATGRELLAKKIADEGLSQAFNDAYCGLYDKLVAGDTGVIRENDIKPVDSATEYAALPVPEDSAELLKAAVLVKLNGGLGTSMGLEKSKSLLEVKDGKTFLDLMCDQVVAFRESLGEGGDLKFMLMNSFSTSDDTKAYLQDKYPKLAADWKAVEIFQNKAPKLDADTLDPVTHEANPSLEWCPPGHGDIYAALYGSGQLKALVEAGVKYMFVSNSDNLGATMDVKMLKLLAESGAPMIVEVCERTEMHKKGGHLAMTSDGKGLLLRETAQCHPDDEAAMQDIHLHRYFNTNNLWFNLEKLLAVCEAGPIDLPLIRNPKTVDPRDKSTKKVFQLEVAMGAAVASLGEGCQLVNVPYTRFAPVKSCDDLFALRSDCYELQNNQPVCVTANGTPTTVSLDSAHYKLVDSLATLGAMPSLKECSKLTVKGKIVFAEGVVLKGDVSFKNTSDEVKTVEGRTYENEAVEL